MSTSFASSLQVSRLRGVAAAKAALPGVNLSEMRLFARSLAHEVVDHIDIPELSESSCSSVAEVWARAARSGERDEAISSVVEWILGNSGMTPDSGLRGLGFGGWDDLVRAGLGLEDGESAEGVDMLAEMVASEAESLMGSRALEVIPSRATVEMSYIPGWDGESDDTAVEHLGLAYTGYWSSVGTIQCGPQFVSMMRFFNVSAPDLLDAVKRLRPDEYDQFAEGVMASPAWKELSSVDRSRPSLMTAEDLLTVIENASQHSIPNLSFQVRLKTLLACDPGREITLESPSGKYHIGCHDGFVNGAGYMDAISPPGPVAIDLQAGALISEGRWRYSLSKVYWHVKSEFQVGLRQASEDQIDLSRLMNRMVG